MHQQKMPRAVLLVDADNFNDERWLESAQAQLQQACGRAPLIKAYGAAHLLNARNAVWSRLGAETTPNLVLEKNTTDATLIADAVELCLREGFRVFAIASGDADFAPLAIRLRRWGCEVWCFANAAVLFRDAVSYYDKVVTFKAQPVVASPVVRAEVTPKLSAQPPKATELPVSARPFAVMPVAQHPAPGLAPAVVITAKAPQPVQAVAEKATPAKQPVDAAAKAFRREVFQAIPQLAQCKPLLLKDVVHGLRGKGVIGKNEKLQLWIEKFGAGLVLTPAYQPHTVTYRPEAPSVAKLAPVPALPPPPSLAAGGPCVVGKRIPRGVMPPMPVPYVSLRTALWEVAYRKVCVADVLLTVPELLMYGGWIRLADVAGRLRAQGLLAVGHSALKILKCHPYAFAVDERLQFVRYVGVRA